jgi:hypothetical protein
MKPGRRLCASIVLTWIGAGGGMAGAAPPIYVGFQLQARTNFGVNPGGSYNVPPNYFFSGEDIKVNDARQVSFHLSVTGGNAFQSVWFGQNGAGGIVYNSANDAFLSQTSLNNFGRVVWETTFSPQNGIYFYDHPSMTSGFLTNRPLGATSWSSPRINDAGHIGYRVNFAGSGQAFYSWEPPNTVVLHAAEAGVEPLSPYSFLFTPNFNNHRRIAAKVRLGAPGQTGESQPDEVRLFASDESSILIARDRDADASSPYARFDNSVGVNDQNQVAFISTLQAGGRGVFLSDGSTTLTIATTTAPATLVTEVEFFAPAVNNAGVVVFRGRDTNGRRAIWAGDGSSLKKIVTHLDILPSDQGPARVEQHDSSPVFGGAPSINRFGDVAFNAALTPPDNNQIEWGTGVYVALAARKGDVNCDGAIDALDVPAFVLAAVDPAGYGVAYPLCSPALGDLDYSDRVDGLDVQFLVEVLIGP